VCGEEGVRARTPYFCCCLVGLIFEFGFSFETQSYYVAQAGLELVILLPQPPQSWDYKSVIHIQLVRILSIMKEAISILTLTMITHQLSICVIKMITQANKWPFQTIDL
jgi:hypothetical protein